MAKQLKIAPGLALPLDVVTEALGIVATRGAGKTYTSVVLVEEAAAAGVQVAVIDPSGVYYGLRSNNTGDGPGLPVYVFGGAQGDLPLEAHAGGFLADLIVDSGHSFVFDVSDLSKSKARTFVADLLERLYDRKARERTSLLLVIDEADEYAPQLQRSKGGDAPRCLGAVETIAKRGRSRGIGCVLITQRTQALNKDVLDLIETLIAMRQLSERSRESIAGWIADKELRDEAGVLQSLQSLPTGQAWIWSPVRGILKRVGIRQIRTFDSYKTPEPGRVRVEPKARAELDLAALGEQMTATVERAKATDPRELTKRIRALERQLAEMAKQEPITMAPVERVEVEVPVLPDGHADALSELHATVDRAAHDLLEARARLGHLAEDAAKVPTATAQDLATEIRRPAPRPPAPEPQPTRASPMQGETRAASPTANGEVNAPRQRILDTIAWFAAIGVTAPKRGAVAPLAGTTASSSGFEKNLSGLRTLGLIDYPAGGRLALTPAGQDVARQPDGVPTTEALQQAVLSKLNAPRAAIVRALIEVYPDALTREDLADRVGTSPSSSGFEKNLSGLRTLELIDYPARGTVAALPVLFVESN